MKKRLFFLTFAVAMLAGAQTQNPPSISALFTLWGEGTGTDNGTGGIIEGVSQTNLIGAATFAYTFVNGKFLGDNAGGFGTCSLQSGTLELTTNQGTISMSQAGMSCNVNSNGSVGPNTVTGSYLVKQGTGKFQGVTGTGTVVVSFSSTQTPGRCLIRLDGLLMAP